MLNRQRLQAESTVVTVGFAARSDGRGIAFAAVQAAQAAAPSYLRVPFALCPKAALQGRDVTYAATNAVAETLLKRGVRHVTLRVEDPRLANDLHVRGPLPTALTVPYVALRCRLNRFDAAHIEAREDPLSRDLVSRARAEATLDIAA